jgi:hypothetical protein
MGQGQQGQAPSTHVARHYASNHTDTGEGVGGVGCIGGVGDVGGVPRWDWSPMLDLQRARLGIEREKSLSMRYADEVEVAQLDLASSRIFLEESGVSYELSAMQVIHTHIHTYIYIHIHTYIYIHTYTYIHTHIYIYTYL